MSDKYYILKFSLSSFFLFILFIYGCSSGRFVKRNSISSVKGNPSAVSSANVRILMSESGSSYRFLVEQTVMLLNEEKEIAVVKRGNALNFETEGNSIILQIAGKSFEGKYFVIKPGGENSNLVFNGRKYKGIFKFVQQNGLLRVINSLPLDDYVKGVVPAEMPVGKGNDNYEALKAFAICVRTYAVNSLNKSDAGFDVYLDTRDQVYGGESAERKISNKAVDETSNMILTYDGKPAIVYYHSSCGGHTEKASNVFPVPDLPYLKGVEDGDPPNCSGSSNFSWEEKYSEKLFIQRLYEANLIPGSDYNLKKIEIKDRFESGRVSVLDIELTSKTGEEKNIELKSNRIRYVLKQSNNSGILKSTLFNVSIDGENNILIDGKGYGHGVGLCQWGAIHLSNEGEGYKKILSFYFPGTDISELR